MSVDPAQQAAASGSFGHRRYDAHERLAAVVAVQGELGTRDIDVEGLLDAVVDRAALLTRADGACVAVLDGAALVVKAARGSLAPWRTGRQLPADHPLLKVVETGATRCEDARDPALSATRLAEVAKSAVLVPLRHDRETRGVLVVSAFDAQAFDDLDTLTLQLLAHVASTGLERWRQYKARHALLDERGVAERRRKESDDRFRILFHGSPLPMALLAEGFELRDANEALCRLSGYARDELAFRHLPTLLAAPDVPVPSRDGAALSVDVVRKDGTHAPARLYIRGLPSGKGDPAASLAFFEDVSGLDAPTVAPGPSPPRAPPPALAQAARVDLGPVLARAVQLHLRAAWQNGVRLELAPPSQLAVEGDPALLEYALHSVVENVVRTAAARGTIVVQSGVTSGAVVVQFSGNALAPERLERIMHSPMRDGIGLEEAHRILSLHGGRLWWRALQPHGALLAFSLKAAT